ncbi:sugar MFS transporter [Thalassotalea montiporae]
MNSLSQQSQPSIVKNITSDYSAFGVLTLLFFCWGFLTCLNDILIPHFKALFALTYTQAMLVQFCFFGAYFIVSIPAGLLVNRIGYQRGMVTGLGIAALGCFLFYPAAAVQQYGLFLLALFVLAAGITVLQVAANPYVNGLGHTGTAPARLNLVQAFNALGTVVAPLVGGGIILGVAAQAVEVPYLGFAFCLLLIAILIARFSLPEVGSEQQAQSFQEKLTLPVLWEMLQQRPKLMLGVLGIFLYVGAEVAIGSFIVSFLGQSDIAGLEEHQAATYLAYYWGGAMVGRFIGAAVMTRISPALLLSINALVSAALILLAISSSGQLAMFAILSVGLCNSIMFPTIFSLALGGLGKLTSQASGLLCLAIVGGALIPLLQGVMADSWGVQLSFVLPLICYIYIAFYGGYCAYTLITDAANKTQQDCHRDAAPISNPSSEP